MSDTKPGSILTPTMREFLSENEETTGGRARTRRSRIRQRLAAALEDFRLIFRQLDRDDRRRAVEEIDPLEVDDQVACIVGFLFQELGPDRLEEVIEAGAVEALQQEGFPDAEVRASLFIDRTPISLEDVLTKIDRGEDLTKDDLTTLVLRDRDFTEEEREILRSSDDEQIRSFASRDR